MIGLGVGDVVLCVAWMSRSGRTGVPTDAPSGRSRRSERLLVFVLDNEGIPDSIKLVFGVVIGDGYKAVSVFAENHTSRGCELFPFGLV